MCQALDLEAAKSRFIRMAGHRSLVWVTFLWVRCQRVCIPFMGGAGVGIMVWGALVRSRCHLGFAFVGGSQFWTLNIDWC